MTYRQTGQQGDGIEQGGTFGSLCKRKGKRNQNNEPCIEEYRHGYDKSRDSQSPGSLLVAEFLYHGDCQCLSAS